MVEDLLDVHLTITNTVLFIYTFSCFTTNDSEGKQDHALEIMGKFERQKQISYRGCIK